VGSAVLQTTDDASLHADLIPLAAKVPGYVREIPARDFQKVKAGDLLAQIEDDEYRAQLNGADAKAAIQTIDQQALAGGSDRRRPSCRAYRLRPLSSRGNRTPSWALTLARPRESSRAQRRDDSGLRPRHGVRGAIRPAVLDLDRLALHGSNMGFASKPNGGRSA